MMGLFSRRNLLLGLGGGAAAGVATFSATRSPTYFAQILRPRGRGRQDVALRSASYDDWMVQVGTNFTAHTGQVLNLVDVQAFSQKGGRPRNIRDRAFVARFDITRGGALPEDLYRVAHPNGGTFDIFLTRGSPDKPLRMLAVFN